MYTRRDTFKLLFGAAAITAIPALAGFENAQAAIPSLHGDLLPADGEWFKEADFPELAKYIRDDHAYHVKHQLRRAAPLPERDGMLRLPKKEPYTQFYGLTPQGDAIYATCTPYVKAIPTEGVDMGPVFIEQGENGRWASSTKRVGWEVVVMDYKVRSA